MEIVITAFATLVAAGCFLTIVLSDIKDAKRIKATAENEASN
jgi:hypothetical protein